MLGRLTRSRGLPRRFAAFALLSGLGWGVDFCLYNGLAALGLRLFFANLAGAAAGMATVFALCRLSLFRHYRTSLPVVSGLYLGWTIVAVLAASALIDWLGHLLGGAAFRPAFAALAQALRPGLSPALLAGATAKIVVTPLTMLLNFCAMTLIHGHAAQPAPADAGEPPTGLRADVQLR